MKLQADSLDFSFRQQKILNNVSLALASGDRLALLGPNGGGKSTLLQCLLGLLRPQSGAILVDGSALGYKSQNLLELRRRVGLLFQDPDDQLLAFRVGEDIALGPRNAGLSREVVEERVERSASLLGILELLDAPIDGLSLGQKKRVALAGLLAQEPELLILDEPTAGLDWRGCQRLGEIVGRLHKLGIGILIASHDLDFVWRWANQVALLEHGSILARGSPAEVFARHSQHFGSPTLFEIARLLFPGQPADDFRELEQMLDSIRALQESRSPDPQLPLASDETGTEGQR